MHNLKHNKVMHDRVLLMSVKTEDTPRVPPAKRFEITKLSDDFTSIVLHFGYMESPRIPAALASLRKAGLKFDIMTTSFFVGRRKVKPAQNSGMPKWQDLLFTLAVSSNRPIRPTISRSPPIASSNSREQL